MAMNNPAFGGVNASGTGHISWPSVSSPTLSLEVCLSLKCIIS